MHALQVQLPYLCHTMCRARGAWFTRGNGGALKLVGALACHQGPCVCERRHKRGIRSMPLYHPPLPPFPLTHVSPCFCFKPSPAAVKTMIFSSSGSRGICLPQERAVSEEAVCMSVAHRNVVGVVELAHACLYGLAVAC